MTQKPTDPQLTRVIAAQLLARAGTVSIESISRPGGINHNYRVVTREHGTFHLKFHTASWYPDQAEADYAAHRALAVHELLRRVGLALPCQAWVDDSHTIVPTAVYVATEMPGTDGLTLLWKHPCNRAAILEAVGRYLRRLHNVEFTEGGTIGPQHAQAASRCGRIGPVSPRVSVRDPDMMRLFHPEAFQEAALRQLDECGNHNLLDSRAVEATRRVLGTMAETIRPDYDPPRLILGNAHISHLYMQNAAEGWQVSGCCDFEDVSAGDPLADFMELETSLTPTFAWFDWRGPLFAGYGGRPRLESHKMRVLTFLLYALNGEDRKLVPDAAWLAEQWTCLLHARTWTEFHWFPNATPDDERSP